MLRPLPPRFAYGPAPPRAEPTVAWNGRGVALGRPVVVGVAKRVRAGSGIDLGPDRQHPGRVRPAGFVVVQATSNPRRAMARVAAAIERVAVTEAIDFREHGIRWHVVDFQRGFAMIGALGCHVVQVGGANAFDADDIVKCLSLREPALRAERPRLPNIGYGHPRVARCVSAAATRR